MRLAIVILNWNGLKMMRRFLPSVVEHSQEGTVIVADNGSTDGSLAWLTEALPQVRQIVLPKNYGFAEGYNQALHQVEAEYYLLLNSDIEVHADWLAPLLTYMDAHPETAACQPKLRCQWAPDMLEYAGACGGFVDALGYPFCRGRVFATVERDEGQYDQSVPLLWATGAALMIRSRDYWEAGGLDGRFFAHQEEIDLCWRLRSRGRAIVCVAESVVYHVGGGTLPKENPHKTFLNFRNNLLLLYKNLPEARLRSTMRWRLWLDALASVQFLLKGEWGSFRAVWAGRRAYRKMRPDFEADRARNLRLATVSPVPEQVAKCILWQYYVRGKKTWNQLFT